MTTEITDVEKAIYWSAISPTGEVIHTGRLDAGHSVITGQANIIYHSDVNSYLDNLNTDDPAAEPLPAPGASLMADEVYAWNGQKVVVRQDHIRTADDPDTVPALFSVWRADYEGMDWIANEQVMIGDKRSFDSTNYECIQAHYTQAQWTPPATPSMWRTVREGAEPWVQPQGAHDAYQINDMCTHNGSTWTSIAANNVWEPGVYGWEVTP